MAHDETQRPSKWRRFSSSRLLRIDPEDPCYNFNFLGLPLEIKLLIICQYLSVEDILNMALISKDYKQFIDQYFLREEVILPKCLQDFKNVEDRYVLVLKLDFDQKDHPFKTSRERSLEIVKRLNFSKMKHAYLSHTNASAVGLKHDYRSDRSRFCSFMSICPWFGEISEFVFESSVYVQAVDFTIFKSESSLRAMEALSNNAPYLREVTLRSPTNFFYHNEKAVGAGTEVCSLSMIIESLLEKTAITYLGLINFHENSHIWSKPGSKGKGSHFLRVKSKTLEELYIRSESWYPVGELGAMEIECPNLVEMAIFSCSSSLRCLFHLDYKIPGLADSLVRSCPKLQEFNCRRVHNDHGPWYALCDDGEILLNRQTLCSRKCGMY